MTNVADKVAHVRAAPAGDGKHTCHWPGCTRRCKPAFFSCPPHWYAWPKSIRDAIWAAYRPGQEESKTPSKAYLEAADAAEAWALQYERTKAAAAADPDQRSLL